MRRKVERVGLGLFAASAIAMLASSAAASPEDVAAERYGVYRGSAGGLAYKVHVPPSYRSGVSTPLLVALHGCFMTGFSVNSMEKTTGLSRLADERGFVVVYPSQDPRRNRQMCWNFDQPEHQRRDAGEPSLIAGVTETVVDTYHVDPGRVYVAGASAGAAMSVVMGVTYPDLYAAIAVGAGCEYACDPALADDPDSVSPLETAVRAYREMGERARPVPTFIMQGTADSLVPPLAADRLVTHWARIDDLAIDGRADGDVDDVPDSVRRVAEPGSHPYTRSVYTARGSGRVLIGTYVVEGLGHEWPGSDKGLFSDPTGPNATELLWEFMSAHSMPE
ncbi:MAG: PHB depolymerase family esterase [Streptosporangiales bacterium]|nr:PHB depolymerase family esterase [Streptosporangiales bacterium]